MRKIKIVVACGSGIATSTTAGLKVKEVCKAAGYSVDVDHANIANVKMIAENFDIICTTAIYRGGELPRPVINVISFLTKVGMKKTEEELIAALEKVAASLSE